MNGTIALPEMELFHVPTKMPAEMESSVSSPVLPTM